MNKLFFILLCCVAVAQSSISAMEQGKLRSVTGQSEMPRRRFNIQRAQRGVGAISSTVTAMIPQTVAESLAQCSEEAATSASATSAMEQDRLHRATSHSETPRKRLNIQRAQRGVEAISSSVTAMIPQIVAEQPRSISPVALVPSIVSSAMIAHERAGTESLTPCSEEAATSASAIKKHMPTHHERCFSDEYPLHDAAGRGDMERVLALLNRPGANIDLQDRHNKRTPLSWAAGCGRKAVVEVLLKRGANVDLGDKYTFSPLVHAIMSTHADCNAIIKLLLEHGASVGPDDLKLAEHWSNPVAVLMIKDKMAHAEASGSVSTASRVTAKKMKRLQYMGDIFNELLSLSSEQFEQEIRKKPYLLTAKNEKSETLLVLAIERKMLYHVKILLALEQGKIIPPQDQSEAACNDFYVYNSLKKTRSLEMARAILKEKPLEDRYRILFDADKCYEDSFAFFVVHYNRSEDPLFNALLLADYWAIGEILAENPAKINQVIPTTHAVHSSPLAWAKAFGDRELIEYLQRRGAEDKYNKFQSQLRECIKNGDIAAITNCLSKGASVLNADERGMGPLHWACVYGKAEIIAYLISQGANVNMVDIHKSRTPLRCTIRMHKDSVAKGGKQMCTAELLPCFFLLTAAGANTRIQDINGQNVSHWMLRQGFTESENTVISKMLYSKYDAQNAKAMRDLIIRRILVLQLDELKKANLQKDYDKVQEIQVSLVADKVGEREYIVKSFYAPYLTSGKLKITLAA